ncbi:hypothetical protein M9Y10_045956 [Tritrichomonas musculus]|uniref:Uncharacterized protein n=1 Tax=Tritrichomonas musculus TaxID=1915356 RepID=A0ABR2JX25_9EUKA
MSVVNPTFSKLRGLWYNFQSHPIVQGIASLSVFCEPFTLGIAAFVIVEFFNRVGAAYKAFHNSAHLKLNWFNFSIFAIPLAINLYLYIKTDQSFLAFLFSFTFIGALFSLGYPIIVERSPNVGGSFFQITLIFAGFYYYNFQCIYYFWLAIPMSFIVFKNEKTGLDKFRRFFIAPYLLISFIGIFISYSNTSVLSGAVCIIVGSFFGLILS